MKKFYTLAAALLATGGMLASNPANVVVPSQQGMQQAQLTAEGEAMLRADEAYANFVNENDMEVPGLAKFTWTDNNGVTWYGSFYQSGSWADNFTSWAGTIYYAKVIASISNRLSSSSRNEINYYMFYPLYNLWSGDTEAETLQKLKQLFPGDVTTLADTAKAVGLKYFGPTAVLKDYNFRVPQVSENGANNFYIGMTENGSGGRDFVIMNSNTKNSSGQPYFNSGSMGYCRRNGVLCGAAQNSTLKLSNFDNETSSVDMAFAGTATNASGSTVWTFNYNYSGEAFLPYFSTKAQGFEAANIHVVKTNVVKGSDAAYKDCIDDNNWGPFQRYYILVAGPGLSYDQANLQDGSQMWTATTIPDAPYATSSDATMKQLRGAVFAPENSEPQGIYHPADVEVGFDDDGYSITTGKPVAWSWLRAGWREDYWPWSQTDGLQATAEGFYWRFPYNAEKQPTMTLSTNGTAFNMTGLTPMACDFNITTPSTLRATYHYNPANYLETKELAIGGVNSIFNDGENNFTVDANNGMINVIVNNDALVNIYTTNGMLVKSVNAKAGQNVAVDAANGIYLVKVGGKTVKVAL